MASPGSPSSEVEREGSPALDPIFDGSVEHESASTLTLPNGASTTSSSISNGTLEVDSAGLPSDEDSATRSPNALSTVPSARSHVFNFVVEQGRTFHRYREGKYPLPNDNREQERLDFQHCFMLILLDGRLHLAPIGETPQNVLDIGTGTGIWAIEFAERYESASVIGTDLSPIQPEFVPQNCVFEIDDAEDEWLYTEKFDFIHMRGMMTCFADPKSILQKAYNQLVPGGFLEMQDGIFPLQCHNDTLEGTPLDQWSKACVEAGEVTGRAWTNASNYKRWMEEIGFEDIKEKIFEVPTNNWPRGKKVKELGLWFYENMKDALGASKVLLTKALDYPPERVELLLMEVRKDLKNREIHAYMPL